VAVTTEQGRSVNIQVSPDHMQAYAIVQTGRTARDVTETDFLDLLKSNDIALTCFCRERLRQLVKLLGSGHRPEEPFLLAKGTPASEPVDGTFVWNDDLQRDDPPADDADRVNFYEGHGPVTVDAAVPIGRIVAPVGGKEGIDVHGRAIAVKRSPRSIAVGDNVELDEQSGTVYSKTAGHVVFERGMISIKPVLEIRGDVDFETGNIDAASEVLIRGCVRDLFIVRSKGGISVKGSVDSGYLFAGGDIVIGGGVKGRRKTIIEAGGDVSAKFLDSVYLVAGGDVRIGAEALDSTVICGSGLDIRHGAIVGGRQFAKDGIRAKVIGSNVGVKTVVAVGMDLKLSRRIIEINQKIKQNQVLADKIRQHLDPIMKCWKRVTPGQREQATELMFKAEELQQAVESMEKEKKEIASTLPDPCRVELFVSSRLYPNTEIIVANRSTVLREKIDGPVKVLLRKVEGVTEMVLVSGLTGSARTLPAQRVILDQLDAGPRPVISQPGKAPE